MKIFVLRGNKIECFDAKQNFAKFYENKSIRKYVKYDEYEQ